eukprot:gene40731-53890_t
MEGDVRLILEDQDDMFDLWSEGLSCTSNIQGLDARYLHDIELISHIRNHFETSRLLQFSTNCLNSELCALSSPNRQQLVDNDLQFNKFDFPIPLGGFLLSLPKTFIVSEIFDTANSSSKDSSIKQLQRDIERDKITINGIRITGADGGLDGVLQYLGSILNRLLRQCGLPELTASARDTLSYIILRKVSRTNSGGTTFQALQTLLDTTQTMIAPMSTMAKPLKIHISLDSFQDSNQFCLTNNANNKNGRIQHEWGIRCHVEGSTVFRLSSNDDMDSNSDAIIRAVYTNDICVSIDPRSREIDNIC